MMAAMLLMIKMMMTIRGGHDDKGDCEDVDEDGKEVVNNAGSRINDVES